MKHQIIITLEKEVSAEKLYEEVVRMAKEHGFGIFNIIIKEKL